MNHTNLRTVIEDTLANRIKLIGDEDQLYTGYPNQLIDELTEAVSQVTQQERVEELELLPKIIDSNHMEGGDFVTITKDACFECHIKDRLATLQDKKESN